MHVRVSVRTMVACASDAAPAYSPSMQLLAAVPKIQPRRCLTERRAAPHVPILPFDHRRLQVRVCHCWAQGLYRMYSLLNVLSMS